MAGLPVDADDLTAAVQNPGQGVLIFPLQRFLFPALLFRLLQLKAHGILTQAELGSGEIHRRNSVAFCQHTVPGQTAFRVIVKLLQILAEMDAIQKRIGISSGINIRNLQNLRSGASFHLGLRKLVREYQVGGIEFFLLQNFHGLAAVFPIYNKIETLASQKGLHGFSPLRIQYFLDELRKNEDFRVDALIFQLLADQLSGPLDLRREDQTVGFQFLDLVRELGHHFFPGPDLVLEMDLVLLVKGVLLVHLFPVFLENGNLCFRVHAGAGKLAQGLLFLLIHRQIFSEKDAKFFDLFFQSLQFFEAALPDTAFHTGRVDLALQGIHGLLHILKNRAVFRDTETLLGGLLRLFQLALAFFQVFQLLLQHGPLALYLFLFIFQHLKILIAEKHLPDVKGAFLFLIILAPLLDDLQLGLALA